MFSLLCLLVSFINVFNIFKISPPLPFPPPSVDRMEGYLYKKGELGGLGFGSEAYKLRYFRLDGSYLLYFKSRADSTHDVLLALGSINLLDVYEVSSCVISRSEIIVA